LDGLFFFDHTRLPSYCGINTFTPNTHCPLKIHTDFSTLKNVVRPIVTIGTFDGVHLGHRTIIDRLKEVAREQEGETVLLTFYPHPRMVLHPDDHDLQLISTPEEKAELLREAGIDHLVIYPFSTAFSRLSAFDYVRDLLVNGVGAHTVVIGYDHRFGRNREGDFNTLNELSEVFGFRVEEIPAHWISSINVSSTKIRKAILSRDIETANQLLGYNFSFEGHVVEGDAKGRQLGFPTANISINYPYKIIPANGVYAVKATHLDHTYNGVLNIGVRPTVSSNSKLQIEVHVLDFDQSLYGEKLKVEVVGSLREEKKFGSIDELKAQIALDILKARELL
jgi:riboflavin kinase / FMN adenylyltransferase